VLAHYLCFCPPTASLADLVDSPAAVRRSRHPSRPPRGEVGLDQYQVRRYEARYQHITLACFTHAFLTVTRAATSGEKGDP
jgi:hypothetical protein